MNKEMGAALMTGGEERLETFRNCLIQESVRRKDRADETER